MSLLLMGCTTTSPSNPAASPGNPQEAGNPPLNQPLGQPSVNSQSSSLALGQILPVSAQFEIDGQVIQLEVARTREQQAMGLMYRPALPDDRGMLFPFDPPRPVQFWMRNVPVALDMVFLMDGEVQAIAASVPPCTTATCPVYGPETPVNQVIELRSGRAAELNLNVGDQLEIKFLEPELGTPTQQ